MYSESSVTHGSPIQPWNGRLGFIQQSISLSLKPLTRHDNEPFTGNTYVCIVSKGFIAGKQISRPIQQSPYHVDDEASGISR
jgi:hypothetical protein